jgi:ABC-type polar amino acid transport system ATPase subunit
MVGDVLAVIRGLVRAHDHSDRDARDGFAREISDRVLFMDGGVIANRARLR